MIKPSKLLPGDKIAAISLSWGGAGTFPHRYEIGKKQLEAELGLQVIETRHALRDAEWLDKNPKARADDLIEAFSDPSIKAIISTIGGDDSIRLLPYLNLDVIRNNPKIFLGYSDTTVSHFACYKAGLVSFYGPSIMTGFAENCGIFPYTVTSIKKTLFQTAQIGIIEHNTSGWTAEFLDWAEPANQKKRRKRQNSAGWHFLQGEGLQTGKLLGGCMEVLEFLKGTELWPDKAAWKNAILFLETSEEGAPPVAVKRFLRNLAAQGILENISGLLFGRPGGQISPGTFTEYDQAILRVVAGEMGRQDIPIITNMDFGHTDPMFLLPYGVMAQTDCDKKELAITENAVVD